MTRAARVYDFTIPAGGAVTVLAEGSFYRLMTATGFIEVRRNNGSIVGPLLPGQGERAEFLSLTLTDKSGATNVGSILIGDDTFIDERISGEVSVVNAGVSRALAGRSFMAGNTVTAVPGEYTHMQLWNPVGSLKNLALRAAYYTLGGSQAMFIVAAPLSNLFANSTRSKLSGGAGTVGEFRWETAVAAIAGGDRLAYMPTAATTFSMQFDDPIVIEPGYGFMMRANVVNLTMMATLDFYEVDR